jgi:hypothetical protein
VPINLITYETKRTTNSARALEKNQHKLKVVVAEKKHFFKKASEQAREQKKIKEVVSDANFFSSPPPPSFLYSCTILSLSNVIHMCGVQKNIFLALVDDELLERILFFVFLSQLFFSLLRQVNHEKNLKVIQEFSLSHFLPSHAYGS